MTKDIGWDEKLRVSALRAACASTFEDAMDPVTVRLNGELDFGSYEEFDRGMTTRILARAEVFEKWLTRGGWETVGQVMSGTHSSGYNRPMRDNPQA